MRFDLFWQIFPIIDFASSNNYTKKKPRRTIKLNNALFKNSICYKLTTVVNIRTNRQTNISLLFCPSVQSTNQTYNKSKNTHKNIFKKEQTKRKQDKICCYKEMILLLLLLLLDGDDDENKLKLKNKMIQIQTYERPKRHHNSRYTSSSSRHSHNHSQPPQTTTTTMRFVVRASPKSHMKALLIQINIQTKMKK